MLAVRVIDGRKVSDLDHLMVENSDFKGHFNGCNCRTQRSSPFLSQNLLSADMSDKVFGYLLCLLSDNFGCLLAPRFLSRVLFMMSGILEGLVLHGEIVHEIGVRERKFRIHQKLHSCDKPSISRILVA